MRKVFLIYFWGFYLIDLVIGSRIRLCVQTNNLDKSQQCVFCPSKQLTKILELCTGTQEYSINISFEQAKCLINICNRNQIPTELQQNQFIEAIKTKTNPTNSFIGKFARPMPNKQQLNTNEMNNLNNLDNLDQQNSENLNNELTNNGLSTISNQLLNEQSNDLMNRPISDQTSLLNANTMINTGMNPNLNPNSMNTNWMIQTTTLPNNNKLILKRKNPFKFRIWPPFFFG